MLELVGGGGIIECRDEFTVKILHSSFCDTKIELRSSWCDLCSSFFLVFWRKKFLNSVTLSQLNQSREFWKKKDSPSAAAMKWSDVKKFCKPLRKHSSLFAPQITSSFKELLEVPSTKALHVVIFCNPWSDEEFSCTVCKKKISATDHVEHFSKSNRLFSLHRLQRPNWLVKSTSTNQHLTLSNATCSLLSKRRTRKSRKSRTSEDLWSHTGTQSASACICAFMHARKSHTNNIFFARSRSLCIAIFCESHSISHRKTSILHRKLRCDTG